MGSHVSLGASGTLTSLAHVLRLDIPSTLTRPTPLESEPGMLAGPFSSRLQWAPQIFSAQLNPDNSQMSEPSMRLAPELHTCVTHAFRYPTRRPHGGSHSAPLTRPNSVMTVLSSWLLRSPASGCPQCLSVTPASNHHPSCQPHLPHYLDRIHTLVPISTALPLLTLTSTAVSAPVPCSTLAPPQAVPPTAARGHL